MLKPLNYFAKDCKNCSSPEFVKTGKRYNAACQLLKDLAIISHWVNAVIEFGDLSHYEKIKVAREEPHQCFLGYEARCALDPLVYDGWEIIFNRWVGLFPHGLQWPYRQLGSLPRIMYSVDSQRYCGWVIPQSQCGWEGNVSAFPMLYILVSAHP